MTCNDEFSIKCDILCYSIYFNVIIVILCVLSELFVYTTVSMIINIQMTHILSDIIYFEAIKTVIRMLLCKYSQILSINRQICFYPFDCHFHLKIKDNLNQVSRIKN